MKLQHDSFFAKVQHYGLPLHPVQSENAYALAFYNIICMAFVLDKK